MVWAFSLLSVDLRAEVLTARIRNIRIRSLVELPTANRGNSSSSSTSHDHLTNASPKAISERTSYCQARLEFLLYTQVIPSCCTMSGFGPSPNVTRGSPCPCVARLDSGLVHTTKSAVKPCFHYAYLTK